MADLPGLHTELLNGVIGKDRPVADRDVDDRHDEDRVIARDPQFNDFRLRRLAKFDHRALEDALSELGGVARAEKMHDDDGMFDSRPRGDREHEGVAQERICEVVEGVGLVLLFTGLGIELHHLIERGCATLVVEDARQDDPASRGGRRQLQGQRDAIYDDGKARTRTHVLQESGRVWPGVWLEHGL